MVIPNQMQDTMNQIEIKHFFRRVAMRFRFGHDRLRRNNDVPEKLGMHSGEFTFQHGKGYHVGRSFAVQVFLVQFGDFGVVNQYQGEFGVRISQGV